MPAQPASFSIRCAAAIAATCLVTPVVVAQNSITPSYLPPQGNVYELDKMEIAGAASDQAYAVQRSVTSMKTDTALVNTPQSVTVVTRELIEDTAMQGIGDVTRYVPGAGIAQGEGNRDTPVLRGTSTTADFFVDGVRDDVQYFRDLYNIDRVEVLKGPNAMIFGRGGTGGLINRVTKQAWGNPVRQLTLQAGTENQGRVSLDWSQRLAPAVAFRLNAMWEESGSFRRGVSLQRSGLNPVMSWAVSPQTTIRAGYEYFQDERTADRGVPSYQGRPVDTAPETFFGDPARSFADVTVNSAFVTVDHQLPRGGSLRNHTRASGYSKMYQNIFPGAVNATATAVALNAYNNRTDRDNIFNQTDLVLPFSTAAVSHVLLTGIELSRQDTDNLRLTGFFTSVAPNATSILVPLSNPRTVAPVDFRPGATDADNDGVATTAAVYVQDQVELSSQWQLVGGVRFERFNVDFHNHRTGGRIENTDELTSPRLGVIYKPQQNMSLYASYGIAYTPRAGEQLSSLTPSNQSLEPEQFRNYELGLKYDLHPDLSLTVAAYRLDRSNVAITDPADPTRSVLVDGQTVKGLELGLVGRLSKQWSLSAGYAYQDGTIETAQSATVLAGARLAQLPRHSASLWNRYDFSSRWGAGIGLIYRDEIFAATDNTVRIPGFFRLDAAVFWRATDRCRVQLNVENLLNRDYFGTANSNNNISPGAPIAARVSVTTSF